MFCKEIAFLHVIEHDFKLSTFKKQLYLNCKSNGNSTILLIDILSAWKEFINSTNDELFVMNSLSIMTMDGLVNFLLHLNESPLYALKRCQKRDSFDKQLSGIIIDNISYFAHDPTSYGLLLKVLKLLRKTFGCWIITISYGLEYYNGVENATSQLYKGGSQTKIPTGYINEMDVVLIRDTDSSARISSSTT